MPRSFEEKVSKKAYRGTYTPQIYTIETRRHTRPHSYKLKGIDGQLLEGVFFEEELIAAKDRPDRTYNVDTTVAQRTNPSTGRKEVQVTWQGWPKTHRTWIPEASVKTTGKRHGRVRP